MTDEVVWNGADALRPFLVPITDLDPFPGNPRRGDVGKIQGSLRRFGQVRPMAVDGSGRRLVAGHHFRLAAEAEGWTHIAVIPNEFADDDEARAYLLADNRTHDLGYGDDAALLAEHLKLLAEIDGLEGTGYTLDDLDSVLAELAKLDAESLTDPFDSSDPTPTDAPDAGMKEVVLVYNEAHRRDVEQWLKIIAHERGTNGISETVYMVVRDAALATHQQT